MTKSKRRRGNCYVACESLYHLMGGRSAGWKAFTVRHEGDVHWFLERTVTQWSLGGKPHIVRMRFDPTASQFKTPPDYGKGRARGFLTKGPSRRAKELMERLVWQEA